MPKVALEARQRNNGYSANSGDTPHGVPERSLSDGGRHIGRGCHDLWLPSFTAGVLMNGSNIEIHLTGNREVHRRKLFYLKVTTDRRSHYDVINFLQMAVSITLTGSRHVRPIVMGNRGYEMPKRSSYERLGRAYTTNDFDLFIYVLGEMCPIFFAGYRPNYARWVVRYYLNLVNMENSHPGIRHILQNDALSVKRSSRSFSRTPFDITLEQTVDADAASSLTGIAAFGRSESAK
ncbi:hypothetical protein LSH36_54g10027 [Paralvinella palmiformis]|uniref:Uncharacterized protein n=1 Tax=Paralvinella palmiformis TaxID=53620 RepID=A0AAD9NFD8_9ANNE|nr:hypothetical protein LSH36_54g10027 [Paralvinella palmiformis]